METTAGILRQLHELGRGGALRRVLTRVSESFARHAADPAPADAARLQPWGDVFWEAASRHAIKRAAGPAVKQNDLFGWLDREDGSTIESKSAPLLQTAPAEGGRSRAEQLTKAPAGVGVRRVRSAGRSSMYAKQHRTVAGEAIARLLEVNRSVNGVQDAQAIELPRSRFSARIDLWKGRPIGTPFVMGN